MELLGDILSYHHSYSADIPQSSQIQHRMAYTGTAIFTVKLLQTILPPEKVCVCLCNHICCYFSATSSAVKRFLSLHRLVTISLKALQQLFSTYAWTHHWDLYYPAYRRQQ